METMKTAIFLCTEDQLVNLLLNTYNFPFMGCLLHGPHGLSKGSLGFLYHPGHTEFSKHFIYKTERWLNINLHRIYIRVRVYYSFNLWTETSCRCFFFFSVFLASLICIFT